GGRIGSTKMNSVDCPLHMLTRPGIAMCARLALGCAVLVSAGTIAAAQPPGQAARGTYPQGAETACPLEGVSSPGKSSNKVSVVVREAAGPGPFPAIVLLHGGLSPYRVETLKEESLTRPNYTRFLASGFVIAVPTFRSREEDPQTRDALDDCLAVVDYV